MTQTPAITKNGIILNSLWERRPSEIEVFCEPNGITIVGTWDDFVWHIDVPHEMKEEQRYFLEWRDDVGYVPLDSDDHNNKIYMRDGVIVAELCGAHIETPRLCRAGDEVLKTFVGTIDGEYFIFNCLGHYGFYDEKSLHDALESFTKPLYGCSSYKPPVQYLQT